MSTTETGMTPEFEAFVVMRSAQLMIAGTPERAALSAASGASDALRTGA